MSAKLDTDFASWVALSRVKGLGCVSFKRLASHFATPTDAFSASASELARIEGLDKDIIASLASFSGWNEAREEVGRVRQAGVTIVPFTDPLYPARLRAIADPPPILYLKGSFRTEEEKAVAVVGSRSASEYGRRIARDLSRGLVALGFTVVSGMARGIDGTAHETALDAGGRTIAVLGSGVDRAYPPEHERLYHRICEQGAVVSEFPLGTRPVAFNFPARNRLIAGLSLGVVVVEATEKSGSLITAALAAEQGREVFAVPGEVGSSRSRGAHRLIRQGAKLIERVEDIVEEIAPQLIGSEGFAAKPPERALPPHATGEARRIFGLLTERPLQIDEIIQTSGLSPARAAEILLELELGGFLRQLPGKRYVVD
ncbi:MAG: DNA-processing protein DprA [Candidatus Binatia bacterium]